MIGTRTWQTISAHFFKIEKIRADLDAIQVLSPLNNSNHNNTLPPESLLDFASISDEIVKDNSKFAVKSCNLDPLPTHVLKHTKHLVTFITNIVNKSIITGTFPSSFKRALVSPLIKKSTLDAQILRNYSSSSSSKSLLYVTFRHKRSFK